MPEKTLRASHKLNVDVSDKSFLSLVFGAS